MRLIIAVLVCRASAFVLKLLHRGSSLPGALALKLYPQVLGRLTLPPVVIAVTGSSGKTSSAEMMAGALSAAGREVVYNKEGSNQTAGITTTLLTHCSLRGRVKADVVILESDERWTAHTFRWFSPSHFVVTNLVRDQLTRNRHPESVYDALAPALKGDTRLILNADDPLSSLFGRDRENVLYFGVEPVAANEDARGGVLYNDGAYCPQCKAPLHYTYWHYGTLGDYVCDACGHRRPHPEVAATAADLHSGTMTINGTYRIDLNFDSFYTIYNMLAAFAACTDAGADPELIAGALGRYVMKSGRVKRYRLNGYDGMLLTSKHENAESYGQSLRYVRDSGEPCTVIVMVDSVSRKYFTSEISWLYDIDFDLLNQAFVQRIVLCGQYAYDLRLRFSFTGCLADKLYVIPDLDETMAFLREQVREPSFLITCFSDRDKFFTRLRKEEQA